MADGAVAAGYAAAAESSRAAGMASDDKSIAEPDADATNPVSGSMVAVSGRGEGGRMASGAAVYIVQPPHAEITAVAAHSAADPEEPPGFVAADATASGDSRRSASHAPGAELC